MNRSHTRNLLAHPSKNYDKLAKILEELFFETRMLPFTAKPTLKTIGDRLEVVPGRFRDMISQERMVGCCKLFFVLFLFCGLYSLKHPILLLVPSQSVVHSSLSLLY